MIGSVTYPDDYFGKSEAISHVSQVHKDLRFLIFWGGTDINPALYKQENTYSGRPDNIRDAREGAIFNKARELDIPMLGICRGSQFLCVMSGGELYQDVDNHGGKHRVWTKDGLDFDVTSTHHQMMSPQKVEHEVIGYAKKATKFFKEHEVPAPQYDYEIVWFPKTKCLCVQGHPEYLAKDTPFSVYIQHLIKEKLDANYALPVLTGKPQSLARLG